jgi:predicted Zn-dependent protease
VAVYSEAMKGQPDNPVLQVRMAQSLLADGHTQEGLTMLQSVLAQNPGYPPAHRALADHYEKQGDPRLAAEHRRLAGP